MERVQHGPSTFPAYDPCIHTGLERSEIESLSDGLEVLPPKPAGLGFEPSESAHDSYLSPNGVKRAELGTGQSAHWPKKYFVLRAKTVWIVLLVLLLVLAAIAVGLGVGVSRNSTSSAKSVASTSLSPTSGSAVSPQAVSTDIAATAITTTTTSSTSTSSASVENGGCNNGTTYTATDPDNTMFREYCDTDLQVGENYFTSAIDLGSNRTKSDDFADCMQSCAFYRSQHTEPSVRGTCLSVTWVFDTSKCYFKNATILMDSSNKTAAAMLAIPRHATGLYSAEVIDV